MLCITRLTVFVYVLHELGKAVHNIVQNIVQNIVHLAQEQISAGYL
jgi:hypothetical protein